MVSLPYPKALPRENSSRTALFLPLTLRSFQGRVRKGCHDAHFSPLDGGTKHVHDSVPFWAAVIPVGGLFANLQGRECTNPDELIVALGIFPSRHKGNAVFLHKTLGLLEAIYA